MAQTHNVNAVRRRLLGRQAVVLVGPAGVGKSTIAGRIVAELPHLKGQALPPFRSSTYRPLRHALRRDLEGSPAEVATEVVGALEGGVLWLEDVHWADPGTMAVAEMLVGRVPLLICSRTAVELGPDDQSWTLSVEPLGPRAAAALAKRLHPSLDDAQRARLVSASGGSPLLLDRLVTGDAVTSTLTEAITARIRALPAEALDPLGRLALQGCPADPHLIDLNSAAQESGLLTASGELVWFDHELFVGALLGQIDATRQTRLRRELIGRCDDIDAARHLLMLGESGDAARRALRAADHVTSQSHRADLLLLAVDALGASAPDVLRLRAADALVKSHRACDVEDVLVGLDAADVEVTAEAELRRAQAAWLNGDASTALELLDCSLAAVVGTGSMLEASVVVERAAILVRTRVGDPDLPPLAMHAIEVADRAGVERARARNIAGQALSHSGREGWADEFSAAAELAKATGDVDEECAAQYWLVSARGFYGPMCEAVRLGTAMLDRTRELGLRRWFLMFLGARAVHLCATGDLSDADLAACRQLLADEPKYRNRAQVELVLVAGLADRLRLDEAQHVIDTGRAAARSREDVALILCGAVELAGARGDREALLASIDQLVHLRAGFFGLNATAESAALHALVRLGDAVSPLPVFSNTLTPVLNVVRDEREAHRSWVAGDVCAAIDGFVAAAAEWERRGLRRYWHRALATATELAIRSGLLDRASSLLAELAAAAPIEGAASTARVATLRVALTAARAERALTKREASVVNLAGTGMSSSDIAGHMGITVATVNAHVNSALRKLGCRTRRQAAALLSGTAT